MWLCNYFNRKVCSYNIQYSNPTQNPKFLVKPDPKPKSPTRQSLSPGKVQWAAGNEQRAHAWKQSAEVKIDKITTEILFYIISLFFFTPIRQDQADELRAMEEKLQELLENYGERSRFALSWSL